MSRRTASTVEIDERICSDGHGSIEPELLVVHSTSDPGADADTLCRYWESGQTDYQVHYCVDWLGRCYHCVPDDRKAWHCGNGNFISIGIEICEPPEGASQDDLDASWRYAVEACSAILVAHGWGPEDMRSHHRMSEHYGGSDHTDPDEYFERLGHTWGEFVEAVRDYSGEDDDEVQQSDIDAIVSAVAESIKCDDEFKQSIAHAVWNYSNEAVNGDRDAYQLLTELHKAEVARDDAPWSGAGCLAYRNEDVNPGKDVYQLITDIHNAVAPGGTD